MKVLVIADMEGVTGVVHRDQLTMERNATEYGRARQWFTQDVNAAVEGAVNAGADEVVVIEGHANMRHILLEDLHDKAVLLCGPTSDKPLAQFHITDRNYVAAVFVGFHSMAGNTQSILSHTWSGSTVHHIKMNGEVVGETAINAALCGEFNVPLVAITGDQHVCEEAKQTVGEWVVPIQTKEALGFQLAICYPPNRTAQAIREKIEGAINNRDNAKVFKMTGPVTIELGFYHEHMADKAMALGIGERSGDREITMVAESALVGLENTWSLITQALLIEPKSMA